MQNFLGSIIAGSAVYGLLIYTIIVYWPQLGLTMQSQGSTQSIIIIMIVVGFVFFIINRIVKKILNILKIPLNIVTFGFGSLIINVVMLYLFIHSVNYISGSTGFQLIMNGGFIQIIILSLVLSIVDLITQKVT